MLRRLEGYVAILILLSSMGTITALTEPGQSGLALPSAELHLPSVLAQAILNLCAVGFLLLRGRRVLRAARSVWPLLVLSALGLLSSAWSVEPMLTLRRSALLAVATAIAIYLGERYSVEQFARLFTKALCFVMVMVLACRVLAPAYVLDEFGSWKGLSGNKNTFGEYMAVAVILLLLVRVRRWRWLRYVFLAIAAVLLLLSHSVTSLMVCVLSLAFLPLWYSPRLGKERVAVYGIMALALSCGIYLTLSNSDFLFHLLGRDPTLTGRTHLWSMVVPAILKRPFLGYGYGNVFWVAPKGELLDIWIRSGWMPPRADNGYLDLALSLGLAGLCVFGFLLVASFRRAVEYVRAECKSIGLWPITFLCFFVLHSFTESTLLTSGSSSFFIFAVLATSLGVSRQRAAVVDNSQLWYERGSAPVQPVTQI